MPVTLRGTRTRTRDTYTLSSARALRREASKVLQYTSQSTHLALYYQLREIPAVLSAYLSDSVCAVWTYECGLLRRSR